MQEVWRAKGLRYHRVEQLSNMSHDVAMRGAVLVYGKYGVASLMIVLKESEINS